MQWYQWIPDFHNILSKFILQKKIIRAQILCYKKSGIHWYHWHPTFLWKFNFTLVRRLISALIWDISGLWNRSDGQDFRERRNVFSRFLALYIPKCCKRELEHNSWDYPDVSYKITNLQVCTQWMVNQILNPSIEKESTFLI